MALNEVISYRTTVPDNVEGLLIGLGLSVNEHLLTRLPPHATIDDFFRSFADSSGSLDDLYCFFAKARIERPQHAGKIELTAKCHGDSRVLAVHVCDNGTNAPVHIIEEIYGKLKQYALEQQLVLVESRSPEY